MATSLHLSAVKILHAGIADAHVYIKGRGVVPGQNECDIYAHFASEEEGRAFERQFTGQSVVIEAQALEFTRGIGGSVEKIISWKFE